MKRPLILLLAALGLVGIGAIYMAFEEARTAHHYQHKPRRLAGLMAAGSGMKDIDPVQAGTLGLKTISFVHFNDFHAHYHPRDYNGRRLSPLSLIRGYRDQVKAENPNTLFCSAGDEMEKGSIAELLSNGAATIEIYKELGLDLRAVGNHDFAYGLETLKRFVTEPGGVVLCANHTVARDFHQFEVDGVRIGVFSMVGKPWDERDEQYDGPFFKGVDCRYDFVTVAREIIRKHRDQVDLLFLLSHLGLDTDQQVAAEAPGLDFIIGGHSHTRLTQAEQSPMGTVIVQAGSYGEYVGRLDVMVDRNSRKMSAYHYSLTPVDPRNMTPNLKLEEKIREISGRYETKPEAPITTLARALDKNAVAQLAGEAAMAVLKGDAAVIDVETVWGTLAAGPATRQDLLDCFRVEIQPAGTHGFNSIMTANVPARDWQAMKSKAKGRFIFVGEPGASRQGTLRVALQRRTAMRIRDFFPQPAALSSLQFEMEMWELLAKHLASQKIPAAAR
jgi:5'-nucleotidase/UDP-sugar diphosphatase